MSSPIKIWQFTTLFNLYLLLSLGGYLITANTIPAWLMYLFIMAPFCFICVVYLLILNINHRHQELRYRSFLLAPIAVFQLLTILSSPASCFGFKQGNICYSFLQAHFTQANLQQTQGAPPHWSTWEALYIPACLLYMVFVALFLFKLRLDPEPSISEESVDP